MDIKSDDGKITSSSQYSYLPNTKYHKIKTKLEITRMNKKSALEIHT